MLSSIDLYFGLSKEFKNLHIYARHSKVLFLPLVITFSKNFWILGQPYEAKLTNSFLNQNKIFMDKSKSLHTSKYY